MKKFFCFLFFVFCLMSLVNLNRVLALTSTITSETNSQENVFIKISDKNLKEAINIALNKEKIDNFDERKKDDEVKRDDLEQLKELNIEHLGIRTLEGIQEATGLEKLEASDNNFSQNDLIYLVSLKNLKNLSLAENHIKKISMLSSLKQLKILDIQKNSIVDFSFITKLNLEELKAQEQDIELPEINFSTQEPFVNIFQFVFPKNEQIKISHISEGWSLVQQNKKFKHVVTNSSSLLCYTVSNQTGTITGNVKQNIIFASNEVTKTSENTQLENEAAKNDVLDFLYKDIAKTVFNMAFKRESSNLADASNTTSEKAQWDNFLNDASKSEKWIIGTPEEGHDIKLHAYFIDHQSNTTVIVQHGYNANSMSVKNQAEMFWNQGYNVLLPDARGTGFSEGNYETLGGLEAKDINLWINEETDKGNKVILWGQSMGAATIMLATQLNQVGAIIEDCGFNKLETELTDIVNSYIKDIPMASGILAGGIARTIGFINSLYYEPTFGVSLFSVTPELSVANNSIPKLFIHGTEDNFIPFEDMEILYNNSKGFKEKFAVDGAGHCQSYGKAPSKYAQVVRDFLTKSTTMSDWSMFDWMSSLDDSMRVSQISVPGTHDSAATHGALGTFGKQQILSLPEQLNKGIRFLDIRCKYTDGSFAIHHGPVYQQLMFGDVLNQVVNFLSNHKNETVFMRVKQEQSKVSDSIFNSTFLSYVNNSQWKNYFWDNAGDNQQNPRLGDIRGKIVILYNVAGLNFGLDYAHGIFDIQDEYNADYSEKLANVTSYLNRANNGNSNKGYINFLSSTKVDAQEMNRAISKELEGKKYSRVGILLADFVTEQLITDTVNINKNYTECLKVTKGPQYVIYNPENGTFTNEKGENKFSLEALWGSRDSGVNDFNIQIGKFNNPIDDWYWYGGSDAKISLTNSERINLLNYDLSQRLDSKNLKTIPVVNKVGLMFGLNNGGQWGSNVIIPFYIKAPTVSVATGISDLQKMIKNQSISGVGQAGGTVTITDEDKVWKGVVNSNGIFDIKTDGLKLGDMITLTQINGTGDKSVSDPVKIKVDDNLLWGLSVPSSVQINQKAKGNAKSLRYGNAKLAIVNSDGSTFKTTGETSIFSVSGTSNVSFGRATSGEALLGVKNASGSIVAEYVYPTVQGNTVPSSSIKWSSEQDASESRIQNLRISTDQGAMERYVQFAVNSDQTINGSYMNTISWTASTSR